MRYVMGVAVAIAIATVAVIASTSLWMPESPEDSDAVVLAAVEQTCAAAADTTSAFDMVGVITTVTPGSSDEVFTFRAWIDGADIQQQVFSNDKIISEMIVKDYYLYTRNHLRKDDTWEVSGPYEPDAEASALDLTGGLCTNSESFSYSRILSEGFQSNQLGTFDYDGDVTLDGVRVRHYTLNAQAAGASAPTPTPSETYELGDFSKVPPWEPLGPPVYEEVWIHPNGHIHQVQIRQDGNLPWFPEGFYTRAQVRFSGWEIRNPIEAPIATPTPAPTAMPTSTTTQ